MASEQFARTEMLVGEAGLARLAAAHVAVFGLGGVGSYAAEALVRAGVGTLTFCDPDTVSESNLNRQLIALHSTVGKPKVSVAAARARDINPCVNVIEKPIFFLPDTAAKFDFSAYDYVVDAIDTVSGKMELIRRANAAGVPIICAMGTGNKLDPAAFRVTDIYHTEGCPLAREIRTRCRKEGIRHVTVVFSAEQPRGGVVTDHGRHAPGSISFVPGTAGLVLAGKVIRDLAFAVD